MHSKPGDKADLLKKKRCIRSRILCCVFVHIYLLSALGSFLDADVEGRRAGGSRGSSRSGSSGVNNPGGNEGSQGSSNGGGAIAVPVGSQENNGGGDAAPPAGSQEHSGGGDAIEPEGTPPAKKPRIEQGSDDLQLQTDAVKTDDGRTRSFGTQTDIFADTINGVPLDLSLTLKLDPAKYSAAKMLIPPSRVLREKTLLVAHLVKLFSRIGSFTPDADKSNRSANNDFEEAHVAVVAQMGKKWKRYIKDRNRVLSRYIRSKYVAENRVFTAADLEQAQKDIDEKIEDVVRVLDKDKIAKKDRSETIRSEEYSKAFDKADNFLGLNDQPPVQDRVLSSVVDYFVSQKAQGGGDALFRKGIRKLQSKMEEHVSGNFVTNLLRDGMDKLVKMKQEQVGSDQFLTFEGRYREGVVRVAELIGEPRLALRMLVTNPPPGGGTYLYPGAEVFRLVNRDREEVWLPVRFGASFRDLENNPLDLITHIGNPPGFQPGPGLVLKAKVGQTTIINRADGKVFVQLSYKATESNLRSNNSLWFKESLFDSGPNTRNSNFAVPTIVVEEVASDRESTSDEEST